MSRREVKVDPVTNEIWMPRNEEKVGLEEEVIRGPTVVVEIVTAARGAPYILNNQMIRLTETKKFKRG